jgi:hypothetical protein
VQLAARTAVGGTANANTSRVVKVNQAVFAATFLLWVGLGEQCGIRKSLNLAKKHKTAQPNRLSVFLVEIHYF